MMLGDDTEAKEIERAEYLLDAQEKAIKLFDEIERDLIRPGITEKALSDAIHELGNWRHGVCTHWHKRVVRSGPNTLRPFAENPPDRVIEADDILYVDLVFEAWEADFSRTFVLGDDPRKKKLRDSLEPVWDAVKAWFDTNPGMTGQELYGIACAEASRTGFDFGADIAGHLIGSFPHERIPKDRVSLYITDGNAESMRTVDKNGHRRHWILEIHLHDKANQFGGFHEKLLTVR
ncbi:uncharacterized protein E0L32_012228 [Thyridium curvatum]|uniref:Peptidase M24 domain-containing protein n=1 Tax=Thyridium curvatum TaxID=1093900 RepID=A0A507BKP6_9PEZI|nr:uncharacterized protein E0L32_012228 [Thyridium curvatum]TPX17290.1 hypothetical protein E0L32_012228 [Thyridium curvatum]